MAMMGMFDELFDEAADSGLMETLETALDEMADSAQRFAVQTVDARSRDNLVRVWVNAQCVVVQVEIDEDLFAEATPTELEKAMVESAQAAAAAMQAKTAAFHAATWQQIAQGLGTGTEPMADLDMLDKLRPTAPLTPANAPERRTPASPLPRTDYHDDEAGEPPLRIFD